MRLSGSRSATPPASAEIVDAALSRRLPWDLNITSSANARTPGPANPSLRHAAVATPRKPRDRGVTRSPVVWAPSLVARRPSASTFQPDEFSPRAQGLACLTGVALTVASCTCRCCGAASLRAEIVRVGGLLAEFVARRKRARPHLAVAGLNPHAGESGALGREEIQLIEPAVHVLRGEHGHLADFTGPLSPDTVFHLAAGGEFDGVLCMYHDQGLIPLKLHAFDSGVNVTLGLPFPRTSPDHGTAFDLAGRGLARPDSIIAAIRLAAELVES